MSNDTFPKTTGKPHYEADHRTCVLPVKLEAGKTYILLLNKPPYTSFMDPERRQAIEYWLVFETKKQRTRLCRIWNRSLNELPRGLCHPERSEGAPDGLNRERLVVPRCFPLHSA